MRVALCRVGRVGLNACCSGPKPRRRRQVESICGFSVRRPQARHRQDRYGTRRAGLLGWWKMGWMGGESRRSVSVSNRSKNVWSVSVVSLGRSIGQSRLDERWRCLRRGDEVRLRLLRVTSCRVSCHELGWRWQNWTSSMIQGRSGPSLINPRGTEGTWNPKSDIGMVALHRKTSTSAVPVPVPVPVLVPASSSLLFLQCFTFSAPSPPELCFLPCRPPFKAAQGSTSFDLQPATCNACICTPPDLAPTDNQTQPTSFLAPVCQRARP